MFPQKFLRAPKWISTGLVALAATLGLPPDGIGGGAYVFSDKTETFSLSKGVAVRVSSLVSAESDLEGEVATRVAEAFANSRFLGNRTSPAVVGPATVARSQGG